MSTTQLYMRRGLIQLAGGGVSRERDVMRYSARGFPAVGVSVGGSGDVLGECAGLDIARQTL